MYSLWLLCVLAHVSCFLLVYSDEVSTFEESYPVVLELGDEDDGDGILVKYEQLRTRNRAHVNEGRRKRDRRKRETELGDFYEMSFESNGADDYWVDFDTLPDEDVLTHLSGGSNSYMPIQFQFRFFGIVRDIVRISTEGYAHIGPSTTRYMGKAFYAAPLMTDLNPRNFDDSKVLIYKTDDMLASEWRNVRLDEPEVLDGNPDDGFTFQLILNKDGTIVFAYKTVPMGLQDIRDEGGSVTIGMRDGFVLSTAQGVALAAIEGVFQDMDVTKARDGAAIVFTPFKSCNMADTCSECMQMEPTNGDPCYWCEGARLCGDTYYDYNFQGWINWNCDELRTTTCPKPIPRSKRSRNFINARAIFGGDPPAALCRFGLHRYLY